MAKIKDVIGQKFGRLTVVKFTEISKDGHALWECYCDCGKAIITKGSSLRSGDTTSCGCYQIERSTKHGLTHTREYQTWLHLKDRCYNSNDKYYHNYGGRGVVVCERWINPVDGFMNFYNDMGNRPKGKYSIDRINNDGNYEPSNCEWNTYKIQNNNRRSNRLLTLHGETKTMQQWVDILNIPRSTLKQRLRNGWSEEEALTLERNPKKKDFKILTSK